MTQLSHMDFSHPFLGVFFFLVLFSFSVFYGITILSRIVSRKMARLDTEKLKLSIYECGPEVSKQPNKISAHFYLFALLFILFDVEILFILLLLIGFVYAWKKGALEWHSIR